MRALFLFLFLSSIFIKLSAQDKNFYINNPSDWVQNLNFNNDDILINEDIEDGGSYLLIDYQQNIEKNEFYTHIAIKIINDVGVQNYSNIWTEYDPTYQKLKFHKLLVFRNGKSLNHLKKEDFTIIQSEDDLSHNIYSGILSAGIILENIQSGDIIEYAYSIEGSNPVLEGNYFYLRNLQYNIPIKKIHYSFIFPNKKISNYKLLNTNLQPKSIKKKEHTILEWEINNSEELYVYDKIPGWYNPYPQVQFSDFNSWKQVIDWGEKLYPEVTIKNEELIEKLKEISDSAKNEENKINSIIRLVQDEIRYMGIEIEEYSFKPRNPDEVFEKRFGDCKDKSYLLSTILQREGIEAYITYVNTNLKSTVKDYLPSPTIFNHAIVMFKFKGETYWVDPTITSQRGSFKNYYIGNNLCGLILNHNYSDLVNIPQRSNEKVIIKEFFKIIDTISAVRYTVNSELFGSEADRMRNSFKASSKNELGKNFLNFYSSTYPKMELAEDIYSEDNEKENSFKITERYKIPYFWIYDSSENVNDYVSTVNANNLEYYISLPDQKNRNMPFSIYYPIEIENEISYIHSQKLNIDELHGNINNSTFTFNYEITKSNQNSVLFKYHYKTLKDHVTPDEMVQYYQDVNKISNLVYYQFTYGKATIISNKTNWLFIIISIITITILFFIFSILNKRDITINFSGNPLPLGGWLIFPAIGVFIFPLLIIFQLFTNNYFDLDSWTSISSVKSSNFNLIWSLTFLYELLINCFFFAYSIFLIIILINQRTIFPTHYIIFRLANILLLIIDITLTQIIDSDLITTETSDFKEVGKAIIGSAIWIPYMLNSTRVKQTFVKYYKTKKSFT